MHIVIPMSGIGKRFIDAGYTTPKPLIIVEDKPIIQHVIELFSSDDKFTFICNDLHLNTTNMREILIQLVPNCNIVEVNVNDRKGPVNAVLQASYLIDDNDKIIVSYCDYGTEWNYEEFKAKVKQESCEGAIACYKGFHPHMLGSDNYAFVKEENHFMVEIKEKEPFTKNKMNEYASNGTYYFKTGKIVKKYFQELVDKNISTNGEYYVSMVYNLLKQNNLKTLIFKINKMLQWGTPADLDEYLVWSNYFLKRNLVTTTATNSNTILILPMAGAGSRFLSDGYNIPKPLLPVEETPMIIKAVECLPFTSEKIFICQKEHLRKYDIENTIIKRFCNSNIIGIDYVTEGQACTCEIAIKQYNIDLDRPVLISACDNGVYFDNDEYNKLVCDNEVDIIVWAFSNNKTSVLNPEMYAWLDVDENNYIKRVSIKKPFQDCENKYAIIGTMLFKKCKYYIEGLDEIYKQGLKTNNEFYVDNMIEPLINLGYRCKIFNVLNYLCWGTPNDYKTYNYWCEYFTNKRNILSINQTQIIAIAGDSGSGKTIILDLITNVLNSLDKSALKYELDRYHKWERGNINYDTITHLNPEANNITSMKKDVYNLKIGNSIYQRDYDHSSGKFTDYKYYKSSDNIILCGLHALYNDIHLLNLKIYMDTDITLLKKWKLERDSKYRNHSIEHIINQINSRKTDFYKYIYNQRQDSDIVINYYQDITDESLKCNFILRNHKLYCNLSNYLIQNNYMVEFKNNEYICKLKEYNEYIDSSEIRLYYSGEISTLLSILLTLKSAG
jgi:uridine kinase/UTP-glucose-1-phosphate uridylyltransferase